MTKKRPILKQFGQLKPEDFEAVPVWASCHSFDYDEPWYDDTDEETFRPWARPLPADPCSPQLASGVSSGSIAGFYRSPNLTEHIVEL